MIELRMLGTMTLTGADGGEMRSLLAQPRRFALLAYLAAATPAGFHRRDTLLAMFWPELDQDHARTALRQALRVLRGALAPGVIVNRGDDAVGLDFDRVWSDVGAYESALRADQPLEASSCIVAHCWMVFSSRVRRNSSGGWKRSALGFERARRG